MVDSCLHIGVTERTPVSCPDNSFSRPPEVSAYSSWCLPISMLHCKHLLVSLWSGSVRHPSPLWPLRTSSLLLGFFPLCTVLGVFHPVHSLQPQWGHFNTIHFFRKTLQANWASGETHKATSLICYFRGLVSLHKLLSYLYETSIN